MRNSSGRLVVTVGGTKEELREKILFAVQSMYTDVASCPAKGFHFPTGRTACEFLGYPASELDALPPSALESFAGVGHPFRAEVVKRGDVVLDIGSGSGTDILIAAAKVGPQGRVIGLDVTDAMIEKARQDILLAGAANIEILKGNAESIPLPDAVVDVVSSNGVINLVPDKPAVFDEIARVLKAGGRIQISDIVLARSISEKSRSNPQLWAECIVGALPENIYLDTIRSAGFIDVAVIDRMDYFGQSQSESTKNAARQYGATAITIVGRKPS